MAGQPTGASAPHSCTSTAPALPQQLHLVPPATTRTRRNHGAFSMGGQLACVYSWRNPGRHYGVSVEIGAAVLRLAANLTASQARNMGRALLAAADAAELVQASQVARKEGGAA